MTSPYDRSTQALPSGEARDIALHEDLPSEAQDALLQGVSVGRYLVLSQLGRGGMGVVYKAYDPHLDRNVALKVLRRDRGHDPKHYEQRLLREAQALAKLQHLNVVRVYDAGLSSQGVFLAMELIDGRTLNEWLDEEPRSTGEIVRTFRQAGLGLAAVHDAGIVHRDFKPSNVLVGHDGSVRVLDFGLAHLLDPGLVPARKLTDSGDLAITARSRVLGKTKGTSLTQPGTLMGTPAYMAPEQLMRESVDARSDQYSFCLCLQMAMGGPMPERGPAFEHLSEPDSTPPQRRSSGPIPTRVRRALARGLAFEPTARFVSMNALLAELADPPSRWRTVAAASMLGVGFGLGALVFGTEPDPCANAGGNLEEVWGPGERTRVRKAFLKSTLPDSSELLARVNERLDDYSGTLSNMLRESCLATHVDHRQSEQLFDRQMVCLGRHRSQLHETIDALSEAKSPSMMLDRMMLPFTLPILDDCIDLERLSGQQPLPSEPARRSAIEDLRQRIDHAETMAATGDLPTALQLAKEVLDEARALDYPPLLAEALEKLGGLQARGASARDAETTVLEAIRVAASAEVDDVAARAWTWLLYALTAQGRVQEGFTLQFAAEAAVARSGDRVTHGWLLNNLGTLYGKGKQMDQAVDYLERALELKRETLGAHHVDVAISWFNLGTAQSQRGRFDDAHDAYEHARTIFAATVGEAHPLTHHVMAGLCEVEYSRDRIGSAVTLCEQVLEHLERSPWSTASMGHVRFISAQALWDAGQTTRARTMASNAREMVTTDDPTLAEEIARWLESHRSSDHGEGSPN